MNDDVERIADAMRHVSEHAHPRPDCPPAERIWAAARLELPRRERLAILDHTTECPACAEAWRIAMTLGADTTVGVGASQQEWWRRRSTATGAAAALLALAATIYLIARLEAPGTGTPTPPATAAVRPSPVVVAINDGGGRITLAEDGTLTTPTPLSREDEARARLALGTGKVATPPQLAALIGAASPLMGAGGIGGTFALNSPVATMVAADRPTLEWSRLPGARDYEVTISDIAANYREVASSPALREPRWTVPAPLARGRIYSWQVVARTPIGEVKAPSTRGGEARFQVLSLQTADALANARRQHAQDHLLLGLLYADAGLLDDAEAEFQALAAANPDSKLTNDLLLAVRQVRNIPR